MTGWARPPASACWWHRHAREGFEAAFFRAAPDADGARVAPGAGGWLIEGERIADERGHQRYRYAAPAFGFTAELVYDDAGLVLEYPGIASRAG